MQAVPGQLLAWLPRLSFTAVFLEAVHAHGLPCYCIVTLAMRVYPGLLH